MTKLRRDKNAFTWNQTLITNEIKSSTPAPQEIQNTLGMLERKFGVEKVKETKKWDFSAKTEFEHSGYPEPRCPVVQQQVETEWI